MNKLELKKLIKEELEKILNESQDSYRIIITSKDGEKREITYPDEDKAYEAFRYYVKAEWKPEFYKNGNLLHYTTSDNVIRDTPSSNSFSPDQVNQMRKQMNIDLK